MIEMQSPDFRIDSLLLTQCFPDSRYPPDGYSYNSPYNFSIQDIITSSGGPGPIPAVSRPQFTEGPGIPVPSQITSTNGSPPAPFPYPTHSHIPPPPQPDGDGGVPPSHDPQQYATSCNSMMPQQNGITGSSPHALVPASVVSKSEYCANSCLGILDDDPAKRRMDFMVKHAWLPPRPLAPKGPGCKSILNCLLYLVHIP